MAEPTLVRSLSFLDKLGLFDTLLPFLLVFTIVFAVLEKTRVLGTEKINGEEVTKKNLNAMMAFVVAFLVVASANLVRAISEIMANMVLLLVLSVSFLLLVGSFMKPEDMKNGVFLEGGWKVTFMIIMFIGVAFIFLNALQTENSSICYNGTPCTWLEVAWYWMVAYWDSAFVSSVILLVIIAGFVWFVTSDGSGKSKKKEE